MQPQSDMQIAVIHHGRRLLANSTNNNSIGQNGNCDEILYEYDVCTAIVCVVCFILGVIYTFFGYRGFKVLAFFTGTIFGSMLVYLVCEDMGVDALPTIGVVGISVGAGIVCGIITLLVRYINLFMTGLHFGFGVGMYGVLFMELVIYRNTYDWIPLVILAFFGIVCAGLSLKYQKSMAILGTCMLGSALMVGGLDYYIEKFLMVNVFWAMLRAESHEEMCWFSWAIFACWPFCAVIGAFVQWRVTGHQLDHASVVHGNRIRKVDLIKLRAALQNETQGLRYRDLYKARRVKGDQILQRYSLSIKDKSLSMTCSQKSEGVGPDSANTTMTQLP